MSGPLATSYWLETGVPSSWTPFPNGGGRSNGQRDYAPAVLYDAGKVLYAGGGNDLGTGEPTNEVEIIDLSSATPVWKETGRMHHPRRQHNAVVLPDGSVLVTGGTRRGGFNNLEQGGPVHIAELWNPGSGMWSELAEEEVDRCYHAIAVLLPDATVFSAGGGEYRPDLGSNAGNDPKHTHRDAQIFSPPYLFRGPRPTIAQVPGELKYGEPFELRTPDASRITKVSLVRPASITHSFDQSQRFSFLSFTVDGETLRITPPNDAKSWPAGYCMLFLVGQAGVPSVARMVRLAQPLVAAMSSRPSIPIPSANSRVLKLYTDVPEEGNGTCVTVGITPTCPYGIGACWGGAYEALQRLEGVAMVTPTPNMHDSTAEVYLRNGALPNIDEWPRQFARIVNGTYLFRGVEVTLSGPVQRHENDLVMVNRDLDGPLLLVDYDPRDSVQLRSGTDPVSKSDASSAYQKLVRKVQRRGTPVQWAITGPLTKVGTRVALQVRKVVASTTRGSKRS